MKDALLIALATHAAIAPAEAEAAGGHWIQLIPAGRFQARDGRGPYDAGGEKELRDILARTKAFVGATDMVVDYDHQSVYAVKPGVGGTAKAAGWIKEMEVRANGIWGRVEWTAAALQAIKAGEYRYLSPVIFSSKANGKVLAIQMTSLINTPALDLERVAAGTIFNTEGTTMDKIIAALGLAAGSGEDAVLAALNTLTGSVAAIAVAAGLEKTAAPADVQAKAMSAIADRKAFAQAAGQDADAGTDIVVTAMKTAVAAGNPDPTKWVPLAAVTELQTQLKDLQKQVVGDKAETAVMKAIEDGKLIPALKDWGLELARKDFAKFEAFTTSAPKLTEPQLAASKRKTGDAPTLSGEQADVAAALGIDAAAYLKTISAEQETL